MKTIKSILFISVFTLLIVSCSSKKIMFTQTLRNQVERHGLDVKDIQFYNSKDIVLQRNSNTDSARIEGGRISFEKGKVVEIVTIKKETPGVCVNLTGSTLDISFEDDDNKKLIFKRNSDQYELSAMSFDGPYGRVIYDSISYYFDASNRKSVYLKVQKEDVSKYDQKTRTASGRQVNN